MLLYHSSPLCDLFSRFSYLLDVLNKERSNLYIFHDNINSHYFSTGESQENNCLPKLVGVQYLKLQDLKHLQDKKFQSDVTATSEKK